MDKYEALEAAIKAIPVNIPFPDENILGELLYTASEMGYIDYAIDVSELRKLTYIIGLAYTLTEVPDDLRM